MWQARLLASIAIFFWGASYIWGKIVLTWLSPLTASLGRFGFAAIILLTITIFIQKPPKSIYRGHYLQYFLLGLFGITCFQAFLFIALNFDSAINVSVVLALVPVFTAMGDSFMTKEIPSAQMISGILLSVIGAMLAVLGGGQHGLASISLNWGDALALIAAVCMAFYTIGSRHWLPKGVPPLLNTSIMLTIGAIFLLPLGIISIPANLPPTNAPLWALAALVIGPSVISYVCWAHAIERIGVSEPNLIYNFMPLVTMVLSSLHGQPPTIEQMIGAALVIIGITWGIRPKRKNNIKTAIH